MPQNRISLRLTNDDVTDIEGAITTMEQRLTGLIGLTPDERRELTKMGDKSEAFCRAALNVAQQHSGIMARDFDIDGFQRDLDDVANGNFDFALFVAELIDVDDTFRLQADVDDDDVGADFFHGAGNDGAGFQVVKGCLALLKQFCK